MKSLIALSLFVLGVTLFVDAQQIASGEFWIPSELEWAHLTGAQDQEKTASAVIFYFRKDGYFVRDECWLIKHGKSITISNGDPHNERGPNGSYFGWNDAEIPARPSKC